MRSIVAVTFFIIMACNSDRPSGEQPVSLTDTSSRVEPISEVIGENRSSYRPITAKRELEGIWASNNKEPLTVEITADSIYYTEHFESYKYSLKADSIFISYPDFMFAAKVFFHRDTLVMQSENGQSKYYRFKG